MTRPSADIFAAIASASAPLTLARTADGFLPLLLADLARASDKRLVYVATDDTAMQAVADAAPFFAPDLVVHRFPAWDCLPYDRAGPSMRVSADRLATLSALQAPPKRGELILTTVAAITQRTLTPFRIRQLATTLAPGQRIDRDALAELLVANGFNRVDTVADQGEFAVRGSLVDLFPAGEDAGLRVDFFGDEIESIRRFDPADQRSLGPAKSLQLLPAAETLLDQDTIKRFRSSYREMFGAQATGDPLYQAVSEGRRQAGMDHWLPLFEERLATLFDHIDPATPVLRGHRTDATAETRFDAITDYHANRVAAEREQAGSYRPLAPDTLYLTSSEWAAAERDRPVHVVSPSMSRPRRASSISKALPRAISRPSARPTSTSMTRLRIICRTNAARAAGRLSPAIRRARATACRGCSGTMASARLPPPTAGRKHSAPLRPMPAARPQWSSFRSTTASQATRSACSPNRIFSAKGWYVVKSAAKAPTPSSPNSQRSASAISSSTSIMASAATKG